MIKLLLLTGVLFMATTAVSAPVISGEDRGVAVTGVAVSPSTVSVGDSVQVVFRIYNYGQRAMRTTEPKSAVTYHQDQSFISAGYESVPGAFRAAASLTGESGGVSYPYRWGVPELLSPGQSAVVVGKIRFSKPGSYWLVTGLEYSGRIIRTGLSPIKITVLPKGAQPEKELPDQEVTEESESVHSDQTVLPVMYPPPPPADFHLTNFLPVAPRIVQVVYGGDTMTFYVVGPSSPWRPAYEQITIPLNGRIPLPGRPAFDIASLAAMSSADYTLFIITP